MPNVDSFPTTQIDVKPGDETGVYYVTFCNLPFHSTWQEVKDWLSGSCIIDFVEVFPSSCSGWIRIQGKENFETALVYIKGEPFKDRPLFFDARNKSEAVKIRTRETGPKPKCVKKYSRLTERSQGHRKLSRHYRPRKRFNSSFKQTRWQESVSTPWSLCTPRITKIDDGAFDASSIVEMMAYNDFWTIIVVGMALYKPPQMPYCPPTLVFPGYGWADYYGMNSCAPCPLFYGRVPMPLYPEPEDMMAESTDDDTDYCLDEPQSAAGGRRAHSVPPSFRWAGNETFE